MNNDWELRKERAFSEKLSATFDFMRAHFRPLFTAMLFMAGPFILLSGIFNGLMMSEMSGQEATQQKGPFAAIFALSNYESPYFWLQAGMGLCAFIAVWLAVSSSIKAVLTNKNIANTQVLYRYARQLFWKTVGVGLIFILVYVIGAGLVVGAFYINVVLGLVTVFLYIYFMIAITPVFVLIPVEKGNFFTYTNRCFELIKGNWWETFLILIISSLLLSTLATAFGLPLYGLAFADMLTPQDSQVAFRLYRIAYLAAAVLERLGYYMLLPAMLLPIFYHYFDMVERSEFIGLSEKIALLGQPVADDDEGY